MSLIGIEVKGANERHLRPRGCPRGWGRAGWGRLFLPEREPVEAIDQVVFPQVGD